MQCRCTVSMLKVWMWNVIVPRKKTNHTQDEQTTNRQNSPCGLIYTYMCMLHLATSSKSKGQNIYRRSTSQGFSRTTPPYPMMSKDFLQHSKDTKDILNISQPLSWNVFHQHVVPVIFPSKIGVLREEVPFTYTVLFLALVLDTHIFIKWVN